MTREKTVAFATYGPNRGLSLKIGGYQFIDGRCEVPEQEAAAVARILCRYHDVCYAHELGEKVREYDSRHVSGAKQPGQESAATDANNHPSRDERSQAVSNHNAKELAADEVRNAIEESPDHKHDKEPSVHGKKKG